MNRMLVWGKRAYGWMLRCYPQDFRMVFEEEMRGVFAQAAGEAVGRGVLALLGRFIREVRDWPGSLLAAHWQERIERWMMVIQSYTLSILRIMCCVRFTLVIIN